MADAKSGRCAKQELAKGIAFFLAPLCAWPAIKGIRKWREPALVQFFNFLDQSLNDPECFQLVLLQSVGRLQGLERLAASTVFGFSRGSPLALQRTDANAEKG